MLERHLGSRTYHIHVLEEGFRWGSNTYATPTELVNAINGTARNGYDFFGLTMPWPDRAAALKGRRLSRYTSIELPVATEF